MWGPIAVAVLAAPPAVRIGLPPSGCRASSCLLPISVSPLVSLAVVDRYRLEAALSIVANSPAGTLAVPSPSFRQPLPLLRWLSRASRLLDQLVRVRLTFRAESRRRGFDPFLGCTESFTLSFTRKGQFVLDFLSPVHVESLPVLVSLAVRAFRSTTLLCPLLTSGR